VTSQVQAEQSNQTTTMQPDQNSTNTFQFEQAFQRLETILTSMNSGEAGLDDSLKLYEEADKLISSCTQRLNAAENRVEMLIKNRAGAIAVDMNDQPQTQPLSS
jgi:exodeoxyribonuclease VII small subunit